MRKAAVAFTLAGLLAVSSMGAASAKVRIVKIYFDST